MDGFPCYAFVSVFQNDLSFSSEPIDFEKDLIHHQRVMCRIKDTKNMITCSFVEPLTFLDESLDDINVRIVFYVKDYKPTNVLETVFFRINKFSHSKKTIPVRWCKSMHKITIKSFKVAKQPEYEQSEVHRREYQHYRHHIVRDALLNILKSWNK